MSSVKDVIGFVWASPATIIGLCIARSFQALGFCKRAPNSKTAFVWTLEDVSSSKFLTNWWRHRHGATFGNVVIVKHSLDTTKGMTTLIHELEHVRQYMVLGVFQPILYWGIYFMMKLCFKHSHPHYSSPFEIEARRAAHQIVDIEGVTNRIAIKYNLPR